jgi:alpha-amylase
VFVLLALLACVSVPIVSDTAPRSVPTRGGPPGPLAPLPSSAAAGLVYEIYVRSFQDSDGDGVGDLEGVRSRLGYLEDLGVGTIWLMPLFPAFGPAGYDVTSFDTITEAYGTPEDLAALVSDAHERGMRVLVDLPFNHVHRTHPWFLAADADRADPYRDWFVFRESPKDDDRWFPSEAGGYYYAYFGSEMPDLDWTNPEVHEAMLAVFEHWLNAGADGYRLDAVLMLVEEDGVVEGADASHDLLASLYAELRATHPDVFFLAEASEWEVGASATWLGSAAEPQSDAVLDFPRRDALLEAVERGSAAPVLDTIAEQVALGSAARMAPFLGSHDVDRLPTVVPDPAARRALLVAHLLLPGSPVLYYGDEIDLVDASTGTGQDWAMRAAMPWDTSASAGFTTGDPWFPPDPSFRDGLNVADEEEDPDSVLSLVSGLSCVRSRHALDGDGSWLPLNGAAPSLLAFERRTAAGRLVVLVNLADASLDSARLRLTGRFRDLGDGTTVQARGELAVGHLGPYGYRVLSSAAVVPCALPDGRAGG